ncbi:MAG: hypothetical protein DMF65_10115 [Acidobacteria bacterium]|nr:MAG: hypothetical protein DMF65_10115 [Acidobacteriota bacterium]
MTGAPPAAINCPPTTHSPPAVTHISPVGSVNNIACFRDAHVRADFNLNSVGYGVHSARDGTRSAGRGVNFVSDGIHFIVDGVSFVGERRAVGRVVRLVYFGSAVQTGDEERCAARARRL